MVSFPEGFLWGASTAPHQVEGNNVNSDWWSREGRMPGMQPSGDADDSYHRYDEDIALLTEAGLTAYRFGVEWARIEPRPGEFSNAELAHYRRMIETVLANGVTPVLTLHHFTNPRWFADEGGWLGTGAIERFVAYVDRVTTILDGVEWVVTINEPNMLAMVRAAEKAFTQGAATDWQSPTVEPQPETGGRIGSLPTPDPSDGAIFIRAHHAVRDLIRGRTGAKVGWSVANQAFTAAPGGEARLAEVSSLWEDLYLEAARDDDFVGVQAYSSQQVDADGIVPHPQHPDNTLVGTAYRPDALEIAVRHTTQVTGGVPVLVTENGIATSDDDQRIAYTSAALTGLNSAIADGSDVRGYLHWSLLDNYEWGHWEPTFGLVAVNRTTFVRTPKPSLQWLGAVARRNGEALQQMGKEARS